MKKQFIDLSHTIKDGELTYKGLPAPIICDYISREQSKASYEEGTSFQIGKIELVGNSGTYMDSPFHRYKDGKDLSEISLKKIADLPAILIHAPWRNGLEVGIDFFKSKDLQNKAVLIHTGWSEFWQSDQYFENHPFVSEEAAQYLSQQRVALVGIDSHNIDDTRKKTRPVHSILLKQDILIVEHMNALDQLIGKEFTFSAIPPKIENFGTFPVRAFATITT